MQTTQAKKRIVIDEYIRKHARAPTKRETIELLSAFDKLYPDYAEVGMSGARLTVPDFRVNSSIDAENTNRRALMADVALMFDEEDYNYQRIEDLEVGFRSSVERISSKLAGLESRLNNLLLGLKHDESFLGFVEESFESNAFIDSASTVKLESGYCTLGRGGYNRIPQSDIAVKGTMDASSNLISFAANSPPDSLAEDDGKVWTAIGYSSSQVGRVSLYLDFTFREPKYIGDIRISGLPVDMNTGTRLTVFVSQASNGAVALTPAELPLDHGENFFSVGRDEVTNIRLVFSKQASDALVYGGQYAYFFSFDSIQFYSDKYSDSEAILIAGPYPVKDYTGSPLYFTQARLEACTVCTEGSSVDFFLSKDATNWVPVAYNGTSYATARFGNPSPTSVAYLDATKTAYMLAYDVVDTGLQTGYESYLNKYIPTASAANTFFRNITLKRNLPQDAVVYGAPAGWREVDELLVTTIYVSQPEGRYFDLGGTSAYLNGVPVTGRFFAPQGYSEFATNPANYISIPDNLLSLEDLRSLDPLYPYNHKYIVEGYAYPQNFSGERVYGGADEYFGALLKYVSPERFTRDAGFGVFTVLETTSGWLIKVNVDKSDSSWRDELFDLDWFEMLDGGNNLYVKAALNSKDSTQSAIIKSFAVRVI